VSTTTSSPEHQPKTKWGERIPGTQTCRMFESDFLEKFSRIHPATPFVVYVPLMAFMIYRSAARLDAATIAALYLGGLFVWSLTEYWLHRLVFHWTKDSPRGRRIHFLLHGVHHDFPNDRDRLVMPLLTSAPLAVIFYTLFYVCLGGVKYAEPIYAGFTLGYLAYDGTHYAVHHFKQESRIGRFLKRHHMLHHHADHAGGFGVSSPLWDIVFRTMPQVKKLAATQKTDAAARAAR
jgi:sterol desaturase/sphingolipid hydroxylase (fatty acid hydroxylase superfamily)